MLVLDDEAQEPAEIVEFAAQIGVEQGVITFASAPEHIVCAAESVRRLERVADLARRPGEDLRVRAGGRAGHVTRVAKQVGGAPEQLAACERLQPLEIVDGFGEVAAERGDVARIGHHVDVVEGVEGQVEPLEEIECRLPLGSGGARVVRPGEPGPGERPAAEHVRSRPAERVPEADREAQMVFHPPAEHDPILVVPAISELVVRLRALVGDDRQVGEDGHGCAFGGGGQACGAAARNAARSSG